jgi:LDH2 family malate/lactate/ureidoglycolate dehydrogenase
LGFAINVKAHLSIGRSLLLPLLRIPSHPGIKAIAVREFGHWGRVGFWFEFASKSGLAAIAIAASIKIPLLSRTKDALQKLD